MKIALGSDHGGYTLKEAVKEHLQEAGYEIEDCGCYSTKSCDYPEFGHAVAHMVADGKCDKGIVVCTTGIGISIAANKVQGIRCALCTDPHMARMSREHNDANILAMGEGIIGKNLAMAIVDVFMNTEFSTEEKHHRRVSQIEKI